MENSEKAGTEKIKNNRGVTQNPTRYNNQSKIDNSQKNMSSDDEEVNPSDLDKTEVDLDKGGVEFGAGDENDATLDDEAGIAREGYNGNAGTNQSSRKTPISRQ